MFYFRKHLKEVHNLTDIEYYTKYVNNGITPVCKYCGKPVTKFKEDTFSKGLAINLQPFSYIFIPGTSSHSFPRREMSCLLTIISTLLSFEQPKICPIVVPKSHCQRSMAKQKWAKEKYTRLVLLQLLTFSIFWLLDLKY